MKALFDEISIACSKTTTKAYSTSFSLGIYYLHSSMRNPIYAIYGFVRFADEIVDTFEGFDKANLLKKFTADTYEAIEHKISLNPILNAFQAVVNQYDIEHELITTFLRSMEMDLDKKNYNQNKYEEYILGSAEVVGLMCLHVFVNGDKDKYELLKPYAMKLGAAFQKVNFLRDLKDDYQSLGRTYFPNVDMTKFSQNAKNSIENEIALDFADALKGIKMLPKTSKGGVYLAYVYYISLFNKIKNVPAEEVLSKRIRISNGRKFALMLNSMFQFKFNLV